MPKSIQRQHIDELVRQQQIWNEIGRRHRLGQINKSQPWDFAWHHSRYSDPNPVARPGEAAAIWPQPRLKVNDEDTAANTTPPTPGRSPRQQPNYLPLPSIDHSQWPENQKVQDQTSEFDDIHNPSEAGPVLTNAELGQIAPLYRPDTLKLRPFELSTDPDESAAGGPDHLTATGQKPASASTPTVPPGLDLSTGPINPLWPQQYPSYPRRFSPGPTN